MLIFSEPEKADRHSYGFDGWAEPDLFHYTGEGRIGDQRFVEGNKAILEHRTETKALRVFRAKPPWATYLGEFEVDRKKPYYLADSPGVDGLMRQVIVFRLRPIGRFVDGGLGRSPELPSPGVLSIRGDETPDSAVEIPVEESHSETFMVQPPAEPSEYVRREAALVGRYKEWLRKNHHASGRHRIAIKGELAVLYTDLYDYSDRELIEAKATSSRNSVRAGLGQLLDYARYVKHDRRSLLLPSVPRADLLDLLRMYWCGCIWETRPGHFARQDP